MQSWLRKLIKSKKEKKNKDTKKKIRVEKIDIFMNLVAVLSVIAVVLFFIAAFVIKELDWIIAILSAFMLAVSLFIRKLDPYISFTVLMVMIIGTVYSIVMFFLDKVGLEANADISRLVSAVCLGATFIIEMIHSYKGMKKISAERVKALKENLK